MSISSASIAIETEARVLGAKFVTEWGVFRRLVASYPLGSTIVTAIVFAIIGHVI